MTTDRIPCKYGHDVTLYNRADRRCGRCHSIREARYRQTVRGREITQAVDARREGTPNRWFSRFKSDLKRKIAWKRDRISELEGQL